MKLRIRLRHPPFKMRLLSALGLVTIAASIAFGLIRATPCSAQSQTQDQSEQRPALEYEVASIKLFVIERGANPSGRIGYSETPDGLVAERATVRQLIQRAYGVEDYQISGAADWVNSEHYDVEARLGSPAVDELQKLSPNDRIQARQHMLQTLLADRFNLTIHRENKEVQVYMLIVAKNGPKLQQAKPVVAESDKPKNSAAAGNGYMTVGGDGGVMSGQGVLLATLARMLTAYLHRPVLDKTGLIDKYDFTLRWTPDQIQPQRSSGSQGPPGDSSNTLPATDPNGGPSLFTAIQEQLGLKLESAKGPVEFIAIDRIERPSGN